MITVLFAHERPSVARAVTQVLNARGFDVETVRDGDMAARALEARPYGALVVDVALPGRPGYELVEVARMARGEGNGAGVVVLVASVFRKTSYKRRPARLYGADDYVELHHLGDMLPDKLAGLLGISARPHSEAAEETTAAVIEMADARMEEEEPRELASLIVADVVLYNGDRIAATQTVAEARAALSDDLDIATDLLRQVHEARGLSLDAREEMERAFSRLMQCMGRRGGAM